MRSAALLSLLALLVLLAAATAAAPRLVNDYAVRVLIVMCINAVLVASLGVGNGFTGVFSLGHVGFVAVGAYASGILSLSLAAKHAYLSDLPHWLGSFSLPFLPATIAAGLVCTALAFVAGAPLMRLSGYFVSVATRGFLIIVNVILINATDFRAAPAPSPACRGRPRCHGRLAGWPSRSLCFRVSSIRLTVGDTGRSGKIRSRHKRSAYPCCRPGCPPSWSVPSLPVSAARYMATISVRFRRRASIWRTLSRSFPCSSSAACRTSAARWWV